MFYVLVTPLSLSLSLPLSLSVSFSDTMSYLELRRNGSYTWLGKARGLMRKQRSASWFNASEYYDFPHYHVRHRGPRGDLKRIHNGLGPILTTQSTRIKIWWNQDVLRGTHSVTRPRSALVIINLTKRHERGFRARYACRSGMRVAARWAVIHPRDEIEISDKPGACLNTLAHLVFGIIVPSTRR